jgi:hypothetical protein
VFQSQLFPECDRHRLCMAHVQAVLAYALQAVHRHSRISHASTACTRDVPCPTSFTLNKTLQPGSLSLGIYRKPHYVHGSKINLILSHQTPLMNKSMSVRDSYPAGELSGELHADKPVCQYIQPPHMCGQTPPSSRHELQRLRNVKGTYFKHLPIST